MAGVLLGPGGGGADAKQQVLPPADPAIEVGQRWTFHGRWFGLPVGRGVVEVKELVTLNGRQAYHLYAEGRTNRVLSKIYPVHDVVHSYLDAETLRPLRFEKIQREGHYRANEFVTFDHARSVATYHSRLSGERWDVEVPETFQDLLSVLLWFRTQPLEPGRPVVVNVYSDEKIYETEIRVRGPRLLELLKRGTFRCLIVEPKASFKGLLVRRGRLWAYLTADRYRLPLLIKISTPWGPMAAVLDERHIPPDALLAP